MTNSEEKWVARILTKKETNSKALASHAVFVKNQQLMPCQSLCMKVRIVYIYMRVRDSLLYVCMQTSYLCMCMSAISELSPLSVLKRLWSSHDTGRCRENLSETESRFFTCLECCSCLLQFLSKPSSKWLLTVVSHEVYHGGQPRGIVFVANKVEVWHKSRSHRLWISFVSVRS